MSGEKDELHDELLKKGVKLTKPDPEELKKLEIEKAKRMEELKKVKEKLGIKE